MTTQDSLSLLIETGKSLEIKRAIAVRMSIQGYIARLYLLYGLQTSKPAWIGVSA